MNWGRPIFVLFPDGRLIVGDTESKRPMTALLSDAEMADVLSKISGITGLWGLFQKYDLFPATNQPLHILTLRLPRRTERHVEVHGPLDAPRENSVPPPRAFADFLELLPTLQPDGMEPWDPGYVEINWADYSHAPDPPVPWPEGWPTLNSSLVRPGDDVSPIRYHMAFPSSLLDSLDHLLAARSRRGAILIDGWKASAHYRWPLPNEKEWTSWDR